MSYGYGLNVTPLQIATAYSALANGGRLIAPTFVKGQRNEGQQIIDENVAKQVVAMMETVVTQGGAKQAAVLGYRVAGKTGTARKAGPGGYERGHFNALFAGVVPATNPRFATGIVINDPQAGKFYGGRVSAPVYHHVREGTLRLMDVPLDDLQSWLAAQQSGKVGHSASILPAPPAEAALPLLPDVALVGHDPVLTGLVLDSRAVRPGNAFVAIAGFGAHGLGFVEQARAAGASAILFEPPAPAELPAPADAIAVPGLRARMGAMADQFHGAPSRAMAMVGVTGTNGKTSTVQLLAQAGHLLGTPSGSIGTLGAGLYGAVEPTGFTTPLVLQMHALLAQLRDAGARAVAMEVSSHALDQGRVDAVHYDVAVFTNLTRDHLDYHGDMASYGAAKARLFHRPGLKAAVVNLDDAFGRQLFAGLPAGVQPIGLSSRGATDAGVRAEALQLDGRGIAFELVIEGQRAAVHRSVAA
ncbi:hypothetical protein G6F31_013253 [Rhizopus arrhizus]|nr:hypothetical protein G6F31_013253 [Rhizopus arrhizus]